MLDEPLTACTVRAEATDLAGDPLAALRQLQEVRAQPVAGAQVADGVFAAAYVARLEPPPVGGHGPSRRCATPSAGPSRNACSSRCCPARPRQGGTLSLLTELSTGAEAHSFAGEAIAGLHRHQRREEADLDDDGAGEDVVELVRPRSARGTAQPATATRRGAARPGASRHPCRRSR